MGNTNTKEAHPEPKPRRRSKTKPAPLVIDPSERVDGGFLFPQGVYTGPQDFKANVVRSLIINRQLAPFYKGLDSYEINWTDEQVLDAVSRAGYVPPPAPTKSEPDGSRRPSVATTSSRTSKPSSIPVPATKKTSGTAASSVPSTAGTVSTTRTRSHTTSVTTHSQKTGEDTQILWLYRNTHECPICFLLYPRLNSTKCCNQYICTECFVQIKRLPPHPRHEVPGGPPPEAYELISEPAMCPYCQHPGFGVVFEAPPFEWGIPKPADSQALIVTTDMIRPDWEHTLASARRRMARKSAAAQALHQSALLPPDQQEPQSSTRRASRSSANRHSGLSPEEIERRMIEAAIKKSLQEQ